MKRLLFLALPLTLWLGASCPNASKTAYQSISATESAILAANSAYLDSVVSGVVKTNGVPVVERDFNTLQLALHAAAAVASGGSSAPVPATVLAQASAFTNTITLNSLKN